jgi:NADH-quinone oxidoreductase subunit L
MDGETPPALGRYFAYHALFAFAMLGLVLAHNLLQTYVFWELVGLGSYLLIGFYWEKPEAGRAALKAFWTTRIGDVGFALGLLVLWGAAGTFTFTDLFAGAESGAIAPAALALGLAGVYVGAMGKSAQVPFHVWLPDAMEGPTPVSALIHAATMVAAGVYLMVRIAPLLAHAPGLMEAILAIGVVTTLLAGSLAIVERDLKRASRPPRGSSPRTRSWARSSTPGTRSPSHSCSPTPGSPRSTSGARSFSRWAGRRRLPATRTSPPRS